MMNPMHLHGRTSDQDNLQAQHYGREDGTLDTAMKLVEDKYVIWLNWFYDWPFSNYRLNQSLPMYVRVRAYEHTYVCTYRTGGSE